MGRIVVEATIENGMDSSCRIVCDMLVDTGAAYLTLPNAWRSRLGELAVYDTVDVETANQAVVTGEICGPVLLQFGSFRRVLAEVLFIDMEPADGRHEPLLGYIPLEQAQAVVDLAGHRLAKVDRVYLKRLPHPLPAEGRTVDIPRSSGRTAVSDASKAGLEPYEHPATAGIRRPRIVAAGDVHVGRRRAGNVDDPQGQARPIVT